MRDGGQWEYKSVYNSTIIEAGFSTISTQSVSNLTDFLDFPVCCLDIYMEHLAGLVAMNIWLY